MSIYSPPPQALPFSEVKPTLLVAWWITIFSTCIILLRLAGRYIRVETLFLEDKIVAVALLPLYLRMACVHVVLLYGTNNIDLDTLTLTDREESRRITGSQVVLASRIFYAATLWVLKFATVEFLARLASAPRQRIYARMVVGLRYALGAAFVGILVSDLAECQPVSQYWQVSPDPGPRCRQGIVQLLTMGVMSAAFDVILVLFPVPIVLSSRIATKRKVFLMMLFCFGFLTVGVTLYRLPDIIRSNSDQLTRSMWASVELLAATTVANVVAVGSFLRDKGAKKTKYRQAGGQNTSSAATESRRGGLTTNGTRGGGDWDDEAVHGTTTTITAGDKGVVSKEARAGKTTVEIWSRDADSLEDDDITTHHSKGSTGRAASPAESHDSLIHVHPYQRAPPPRPADGGQGTLPHPSPPAPVAVTHDTPRRT